MIRRPLKCQPQSPGARSLHPGTPVPACPVLLLPRRAFKPELARWLPLPVCLALSARSTVFSGSIAAKLRAEEHNENGTKGDENKSGGGEQEEKLNEDDKSELSSVI